MTALSLSPPAAELGRVLERVLAAGLMRPRDTALVLHDLDRLEARAREVVAAFPGSCLHTVAVKANPLPPLLARLKAVGLGAEAASGPELILALQAGFPPERIAFDSPAKTVEELALALQAGVMVNCDNLDEAARLAGLPGSRTPAAAVGLRINPQVGTGTIPASSTAGAWSKFGIPLAEERGAVLAAFDRHPWLTALHLHVGSQGCGPDLLVEGVRRVWDLAREINARSPRPGSPRVAVLDIGGGLPFPYLGGPAPYPPARYARDLARACPGIFEEFRVVTEFGRFLHAGAGWAASRVEYVKRQGGRVTAVLHLGADLFPRECYLPGDWPHRFALFGPDGRPRRGRAVPHQLAGPLCFSGDFPGRDVPLPLARPGDLAVVRDAGAYAMAMWSRYNSRALPRVLGYQAGPGGLAFTVLRERETDAQAAAFWSGSPAEAKVIENLAYSSG